MPHLAKLRAALPPFALALLLGACGGGGGDDATPATPTAPEAPADGGTAPAGTDIGCGQTDFQAEALRLVNARRAAGATCGGRGSFAPAPALVWQSQLAEAAYGHSADMAARDYFSHTGQDGRSPGQRVTAAGYAWSAVGENIAAGYGSTQAVVDGWMASDGHCANLMSSSYTQMALACARDADSQYGRYWTQVLARPR